jgi:hypothetical protein
MPRRANAPWLKDLEPHFVSTVRSLRDSAEKALRSVGNTSGEIAFGLLHKSVDVALIAQIRDFTNGLEQFSPKLLSSWQSALQKPNPSSILGFQKHLRQECLGYITVESFKSLLRLGARRKLQRPATEARWARDRTLKILRSFRGGTGLWIQSACDGPREIVDEDWKAPAFLRSLSPKCSMHADAGDWSRIPARESQELLREIDNACEDAATERLIQVTAEGIKKLQSAADRNGAGVRLPKRGPKPTENQQMFDFIAGHFWKLFLGTKEEECISIEELLEIGETLDSFRLTPPSHYLEKSAADHLIKLNQKRGRTRGGVIYTWTALVKSDDPHLLRGMRKLLSRKASKPYL